MDKKYIKDGIFTFEEGFSLIGSRCKRCGKTEFPSKDFCTSCLSEDVANIRLKGEGILHTYTVTHVPTGHFMPPHAIGLIDLEEGVRITTQLAKQSEYHIGARMKVSPAILYHEEGTDVQGYEFSEIEVTE